jgi:hypothetical protein
MRTSDWEHIKPGWHELVIVLNEVDRQAQRIEIVDWIRTNIQKPDRHCLYIWDAEFRIKFRYERDYILARLRW